MLALLWSVSALVAASGVADAAPARAGAAATKPYYGSIAASRARMRSGPGRTYPATWLYVRADLPVRVIDTFKEWRKVEDPGGTQGWILGTLIGRTRTAMVAAAEPVALRDRPFGARVLWRAAPGVVGRISQCGNGWCRLDVHGQAGFAEIAGLWGVDAEEVLP
jgi:SH3-like domain-containing protein